LAATVGGESWRRQLAARVGGALYHTSHSLFMTQSSRGNSLFKPRALEGFFLFLFLLFVSFFYSPTKLY
jgi:hypothetical protein